MLGRQHLMLSVATATIFLVPYLEEAQSLVLVMFVGAGIGSLIPDVDAPDAAIFHDDLRGLNDDFGEAVNNIVGPFLPVFGYTTKFLIYKPAIKFFDIFVFDKYSFQEKHRSFSHSILGVTTMTVITGVYMIPVLLILELFAPLFLLGFLVAYAFGAFLHMLEDSATKTGIAWNSPFSDIKLKGQVSTGKDIKKPRYFLYYLGGLACLTFFVSSSSQYKVADPIITGISLLVVMLSWLIFMKGVAHANIE